VQADNDDRLLSLTFFFFFVVVVVVDGWYTSAFRAFSADLAATKRRGEGVTQSLPPSIQRHQ